jgi:hypothetical protein
MGNGNGNDEYGVYERLARLETKVDQLMTKPDEGTAPKPNDKSVFGLSEKFVFWLLIIAAASGNLPGVIEAFAKVVTK